MEELPEPEERSIREYVNSQIRDPEDDVDLVQKVGSRRVSFITHNLYDVWTSGGSRWWVITDPTNLYDQANFNSIDEAFTYHIGVSVILGERSRKGTADEESERISPAWRRYMKALDAMADATEAEDYQAIGIRCREALLAYARSHFEDEWIRISNDAPKNSDFKGWADIFAQSLATGRMRSYLKSLASSAWDLAVWLQHYSDANEWNAEMVIDSTAHVIRTFDLAIRNCEYGEAERCPACDSYRVTEDSDVIQEDGVLVGWRMLDVCLSCGWQGSERTEAISEEWLSRAEQYLNEEGGEPVLSVVFWRVPRPCVWWRHTRCQRP